MDSHSIPHSEIHGGTRLFADYLSDYGRLSQFYGGAPFAASSFQEAAKAIPFDPDLRKGVVEVLREQNRRLGSSPQAMDNLARLAEQGTVAVVTGQQASLFSGPAFCLYKGLTAVKLARRLTERGLNAVPLFWLATEDHDLDEANHCYVQDREGNPHRLQYPGEATVPNAPVGSIPFTEAILPVLDELRALLPESASGAELLQNLAEFYRPGQTFGEAFGGFIARLFADFGVIMLNPMDARLHRLSSPVFRKAIESAPQLAGDLIERGHRLIGSGYHAQVLVSEGFTLLFVYINGERRALRLREGKFVTSHGDSFSTEELLSQLERQPETISANVLLRPIMQDALLPTVAYVGGPSELAYFAQAAAVYKPILGRMPVVFPRASFTLLDGASHRLLSKYDLTLPDVFAGKQALREKLAARYLPADLTESFRRTAAGIEENMQAIHAALARLDPTLVDAATNSCRKMQYQLESLEHKANAAIQKRSEQIERDAVRLENSLYPKKTPQERLYSGITILARHSPGFLKELYDQINLDSGEHLIGSL